MGLVSLNVEPRTAMGKNANRRTRAAGRIPAVLYGKGRESEMVSIDAHNFEVVMVHLSGRTALFSIEQDGNDEEVTALLREVQRNPVTDEVLHVDLMEIPRGVPVTVPVQIEVTGECKQVKNGEATVTQTLDSVEISVRPRDMPEFLAIDISEFEIHDKVFARDLVLPAGELVTDPDLLVLNIKPQVIFEEIEEVAEGEEGVEGAEGEDQPEDGASGDEDAKSGD